MRTLRDRERESIRAFLLGHADEFAGRRVLDYGAGEQPYRDIVEGAGGDYVPYDSPAFPASCATEDTTELVELGPWDVIICTQVVQYVPNVLGMLEMLHAELAYPAGVLLITGPTNWPVVEPEDLWRFTVKGIVRLLGEAGFGYVEADYRHESRCEGETYPHGWAVRAVLARP